MADVDASVLQAWIGTSQVCDDPMPRFPAAALAALLGRDGETLDVLPLPWHWIYALTPPMHGQTGIDGHPSRGGFLPPIDLPRRMWAGSEIELSRAIALDIPAQRRSTVVGIERKDGRSGVLVFVTVEHEWVQREQLCLRERQKIVYRDQPAAAAASITPTASEQLAPPSLRETVTPDPVMLFRYSALTYNAHRIHYDLPYAQQVEGYPGLVVQGPLLATLLLNAAAPLIGGRRTSRFSFRAERPAYAGMSIQLHAESAGNRVFLRTTDEHGAVGIHAELGLED